MWWLALNRNSFLTLNKFYKLNQINLCFLSSVLSLFSIQKNTNSWLLIGSSLWKLFLIHFVKLKNYLKQIRLPVNLQIPSANFGAFRPFTFLYERAFMRNTYPLCLYILVRGDWSNLMLTRQVMCKQ